MPKTTGSLLTGIWLLSLSLVMPGSVSAVWPHDPTANLPLCTASGYQSFPTMVADGEGGVIVAWEDGRGGPEVIYAQRVSASGESQWVTDGVAVGGAGVGQDRPRMVTDGAGGAIITWYDFRDGNCDIYAQRISPSGVVLWPPGGVALCTAGGTQSVPTIAPDGAGGAIVAWQDFRDGNGDIYAQRISSAGAVQWLTDGVPVCTAAAAQSSPAISADGAGGAIAIWLDSRSAVPRIYAQRISAAGAVEWAVNGIAVCTAANGQEGPVIVSDNAGGAIIAWVDYRDDWPRAYAQRVSASGVPSWTTNGVALCTANGNQYPVAIMTDGTGGAIATWGDWRSGNGDICSQRISAAGVTQWEPDGVAVCAAPGSQFNPSTIADGADGAIVSWRDDRSGNNDIYAQRISLAGVVQWTANGVVICSAVGDQSDLLLAPDGVGGAVVSWTDFRGGISDIYCQRAAPFGYLGTPEAEIVSVRDVPNDQGGQVKLSWNASYLDTGLDANLAAYDVLRSVPPNRALKALASGTRTVTNPAELWAGAAGGYLVTLSGGEPYYWEYLVSVNARHYLSGYSYVASTACDSAAIGNPETAFMVAARNTSGTMYWLSTTATGYSVDNLAPSTPVFLASRRDADATHVRWRFNPEADVLMYRLFRGTSAGFVPGPDNLVAAKADTGYVDGEASPYSWYKLEAVDAHGNDSTVATLSPQQISGVPRSILPGATCLYGAAPNPFNPATTISFELSQPARVRLTIIDAAGRLVRTLADGERAVGRHVVRWDGRGDDGSGVASGVYICRLMAGTYCETRRLTLLK